MSSLLLTLQQQLASPSIAWGPVVLGITIAVTAFESYIRQASLPRPSPALLSERSRQKPYLSPILHPTIPSSLLRALGPTEAHTHEKTYKSSQLYALDKMNFSSVTRVVSLLETFLLLTGTTAPLVNKLGWETPEGWTGLKGLWDVAGWVVEQIGRSGTMWTSVAFLAVTTLVGTVWETPLEYYKQFVLEEKHGFNKMTKATFVKDLFLNTFVNLLTTLPLMAGLLAIINWVGDDGAIRIVGWSMVLVFVIIIAMTWIYPYVILPLQNTFTPLAKDAEVWPLIRELADRTGFPLKEVYVIDGSKRSSHSNAFFMGLPYPGAPKMIVIFDTLLESSTPDEVVSVLAHELGHWKGNHIVFLLSTAILNIGFMMSIFTLFLGNASLLSSFGFPPSSYSLSDPPTIVTITLASYLFSPSESIIKILTNSLTRLLEYDADAFAHRLGGRYAENLKGALVKLHKKNLAVVGTDWMYSMARNNHPTLVERCEALDELAKKEK